MRFFYFFIDSQIMIEKVTDKVVSFRGGHDRRENTINLIILGDLKNNMK